MAQKIRVFKLAREFGLDNEQMVSKIQEMGLDVRNYMSALDSETAQGVRRLLKKERAENTVEELIRPTVIRRRTRDGSPTKPVKKRPPKREEPMEQPFTVKKVAAKKPVVPKETPPPPPPTRIEPPKEPAQVVLEKAEREPEPEMAVIPEAKVETSEENTLPSELPAELPEVAEVKPESTEEVLEPPTVEEEVEPTAEPMEENFESPPAQTEYIAEQNIIVQEQPPVQQQVAEIKTEDEKTISEEKNAKTQPSGVEVATGPAVLRPSNEAPIIRRRISAPGTSPRSGRGGQRGGGAKQKNQAQGAPSQPVANGGTPPPMPPDMNFPSPQRRSGKTPQRRREVESRDIAPQGRFTGVGTSSKYGMTPPGRKRRMAPGKKGKKTEITTPKASKRVIRIDEQITLQELAKRMGIKATELLSHLMGLGVGTININSTLDADTAKIVASDFEYDVENVAVAEEELLALTRADETEEERKEREVRPPVVTMMGHVDHGKTSLLDALRKSNIISTEAGGITQHIGAYRVKTKSGTVAFIDTPGHEAFTAMRSRGANATDLVVLVAAADDGVMPQTIEAINHSRAADVPIIVAINKCDLPNADPNRTRRMLMEQNLVPEDLGGDIIMVEVSAKTGEGLEKLLEMISLQAEVMELYANPKRPASGVILEAYLDRGRGPVANILVKEGTLKVGDIVVAGSAYGRVRALTDENGRQVKEALPSTPVEVLGLDSVPNAGDPFDTVTDMKVAEKVGKSRSEKSKAASAMVSKPSLDTLFEQMQSGDEQVELKIIVKSDVQGSLEAIRDSLTKLTTDKVKVTIVHSSVGGITESDVLLATTAKAIIVGFNVRPAGKAKRVAEEQGVEIRIFSIIYEVVDSIKKAMVGLLAPEIREETLGQVEVRDTFNIPKVGLVAGSYVTEGKVIRNSRARLIRDSVQIWDGKLASLRRFKDDVKEVTSGYECGISLDGYNDVKVGDVIEIYTEKEVEASI